MRAWSLQGQFGLSNLRLDSRDEPTPAPGEVVVAVNAVSLNYRDHLMVEGAYNPRQPLPLVPCSDGVGRVVALGPPLPGAPCPFAVGDRVAGLFCQDWHDGPPSAAAIRATLGGPLDGMLATHRALPWRGLSAVPDYLDDEQAATLPCAALTAWSALFEEARLEPGAAVLLQGTGGVSLFALQLARAAGLRVIITSSSDEKLERARALGAAVGINYRSEPDWGAAAKRAAGGDGVDLVVEVGGAGTLAQSLRAVRVGGTVAQIGILAGRTGAIDLAPLLMRNVRLQGVLVGSAARFARMCRALAEHRIEPVVDRVFAFEEAPAAFTHLASGAHFGKVVVRVS